MKENNYIEKPIKEFPDCCAACRHGVIPAYWNLEKGYGGIWCKKTLSNLISWNGICNKFENDDNNNRNSNFSMEEQQDNFSSCRTCIWFLKYIRPPEILSPHCTNDRCRRHAPTRDGYPIVFPDDWCGDHKLSEAKIP